MATTPRTRKGWWRAQRSAAAGPVLRHVRELLDGMELVGIDAVRAEIALDLADLVDGARIRQDPGRFLTAVGKLEQVLAKLPTRAVPEGGVHVDAVEAGDGDDSDPLAEVLGAGPEVGDAADFV